MPPPDEWASVAVPGRSEQFAGAEAVAYETTFSDPRDESDAHVLCVFASGATQRPNHAPAPIEGDVRGGGMMDRVRISTDEETATVIYTIGVCDTSLWWPHSCGEQSQYVFKMKLSDDEHAVAMGLRPVSYNDGLWVNDGVMPVRGVTFDTLALSAGDKVMLAITDRQRIGKNEYCITK